MKRQLRRLAWVGIAMCVVILAFGVTTRLLGSAPGVTEANVKRLRLGMTRAEVNAILGQLPPTQTPQVGRGGFGASTVNPKLLFDGQGFGRTGTARNTAILLTLSSMMHGEEGTARIVFGEDDRLTHAEWWPNPGAAVPKAGLGERLRSWLP